jgi:putative toxin-antitoxin system antitoxin component (TIGR02293 family)
MARFSLAQQPTLRRIREIERGLPYRRVEKLTSELDETDSKIAHLVQIAPRTLARRKQEGTLKPDESERVDRIERIYHLATELFEGDKVQAVNWLKQPNRGLANRPPLDFARTEIGAREVENLIGRLEHGVFS